MKIYRKIFLESSIDIHDLYDLVESERNNIINEFLDEGRVEGSMMSWSVIPYARLKKIWVDFAKHGFVRDTNGLNSIIDKMIKNLARLQASTDLSGHSQFSIEDFLEENEYPEIKGDNSDFYFNFLETEYGTPVSDYGLDPLWNLAFKLIGESDPVQQLVLVDRMLQITHQRGDLAALFVEGGRSSLNDLSQYIPEEYQQEEMA